MRIFVSSLITGMEPFRQAARVAITTLGHQPVMAEDFGAREDSPQVACLSELRESDLVVLILGEGYGWRQPSGLSPTHEEYREARGRKTVLAFVQDGVTRGPEQTAFLDEVQGWEQGLFRAAFKTPAELQAVITRAVHDWQLAQMAGPLDPESMLQEALELLPAEPRGVFTGRTMLAVGVVGGPLQSVLRPIELEDKAFHRELQQQALFGEPGLFDTQHGSKISLEDHSLILTQEESGASLVLDERGCTALQLSARGADREPGMMVLLEEDVQRALDAALAYVSWLYDRIDPTQRLTHAAVAARITAGGYLAWRTRSEHRASPNSVELRNAFDQERPPVHLNPPVRPRAALKLDRRRLTEDLLVLLRRQWR